MLALMMCVAACSSDTMAVQAKCSPLGEIQDFKDGACAQPLPNGVVAADTVVDNKALTTGKVNGQYVTTIPIALSEAMLQRGQNRFNVYCAPCHGAAGYGDGVLTRYQFPVPPSFHSDALRNEPVGFYFDVITNGYGRMYPYATQLGEPDRWAVIAYIRALQLSQHAPAKSLPPGDQEQLP
ncbi:MAG TPA: cytochrome c [Phototrophicaceae bacterium]|nr:cytochrome c [Phototrophicaceae bacterium]